jgi:hypothetical protein
MRTPNDKELRRVWPSIQIRREGGGQQGDAEDVFRALRRRSHRCNTARSAETLAEKPRPRQARRVLSKKS